MALCAVWMLSSDVAFGQQQQSVQVPKFQCDPAFPQRLLQNWAIGAIGGMAGDSHDHIWGLHRPGPLRNNERFAGAAMTPLRAECCIPAPPVLAFDQDGKFLAQFGHPGKSGGSSGTRNLGGPAILTVDSAINEVFVADGYRNRPVIAVDTETLVFKRMWRAYGNKPDDTDLGPYNPDALPVAQFRLPHNVALSKYGLVYVAGRLIPLLQAHLHVEAVGRDRPRSY